MRLRSQNHSESPAATRSSRRQDQQKENIPVTVQQRTNTIKPRKAPVTRKAPIRNRRNVKAPEPKGEAESEGEVESVLAPFDDKQTANPATRRSPQQDQPSLPPSSDVPQTLSSSFDQGQNPEPPHSSYVPSSPWSGPKFDASQSELGDYVDEPSRGPDPLDPFGFLAAERQLQMRRESLKRKAGSNRAELSFEEEAAVAAELEWELGEEEEDEDAPRAFATPKRPRVSNLRRSTRRSSAQSLSQVPSSGVTILEATPERPGSPRLTTMELEELLPKRRPVKKLPKLGQRTTAKKERKVPDRNKAKVSVVDRDSEDETEGNPSKKSKRPRRGAKKDRLDVDDEQEEIDPDVDETNFKAREDRKKALSELDNYKFETETEIWL
ncbi:hypothetical protein FS837_011487 [Tulasnella sp. UAMH 9824]|nr:hypothetical protein FS837_011487 [Tulasnella sp. UAMH 9824]